MSKYLVETPIFDGEKRHLPGAAVELTDKQAEALLACGAIKPVPSVPAKAETISEPAKPKK